MSLLAERCARKDKDVLRRVHLQKDCKADGEAVRGHRR